MYPKFELNKMQIKRVLPVIMLMASILAPQLTLAQNDTNPDEILNHKWRIALSSGIAYRTASTKDSKQALINQGYSQSEVDNYFNGIKWGPKISGQFHYLLNSKYGIGVDYHYHQSSGKMTGVIDPQDGLTLLYGTVEDQIYTNFAGLSFYSNQWLIPNKLNFYAQSSFGLTLFRQENISFYTPILITGKAPGLNLETGLDYFIHKNIALGLSLNYFISTIKKISVDDGNSTSEIDLDIVMYEGLSRLDAGLGVRFYF